MPTTASEISLVIQPFIKVDTVERQLASLLRCTGKSNVNLVLFSDHPGTEEEYIAKNERVMERLAAFREAHRSEFNDVVIHRTDRNRGPYATCQLAIDFALGLTDFAIFSEDDTVFAEDAISWFRRMYESGILDRDDTWAIAGESIYFDARDKHPSVDQVTRARALCIEKGYHRQFIPFEFIPSTCFATTRAKWSLFGAVRGQVVGDQALCELCARERKYCIFPIVPRVKDIGMLHPDGHSVRVLGTAEVRGREPKNTYLMSEDVLDSTSPTDHFERFMGDLGQLFQETVMLGAQNAEGESHGAPEESSSRSHLAESFDRAQSLVRAGDRLEGRRLLTAIVEELPDFPGAHDELVTLLLPGRYYTDVLADVHRLLRPRTYLEIGVEIGGALSLATGATMAAGVALVAMPLEHSLPPRAKLFHTTSDAFFDNESLESVFGGSRVDLSFVDGLHWFEQALRDFMNAERWASKDGVILLHDCLPVSRVAAERHPRSHLWVGDVWKVLECLREYRPDLSIKVVPTPPSGLVVVRRLDPTSNVLAERLAEIEMRYRDMDYPCEPEDWGERYEVIDNTEAGLMKGLSS